MRALGFAVVGDNVVAASGCRSRLSSCRSRLSTSCWDRDVLIGGTQLQVLNGRVFSADLRGAADIAL